MLTVTNLTGFGASSSELIPSITSGAAVDVDGGQQLAHTITTNFPATIVIGGADAAQFELASNALGTSRVLTWVGDGTQSHASPADADTDNVYDITLTPYSATSVAGTAQNLSVTVGQDWVDAFTATFTTDESGWNSTTLRQVIPAALITVGGTHVRLVLECPQVVGALYPTALYIGEQDSGDAYDMKSSAPAPAQLMVGASGSFTMALDGADIRTDDATFTIDETKTYVITAQFGAGDGFGSGGMRKVDSVSGAQAYQKSGADAATANASGYSTIGTGSVRMVKKIQVHS